jgi:hypothetical protein
VPIKRRLPKDRVLGPITLESLTETEYARLVDQPEPPDADYGDWWSLTTENWAWLRADRSVEKLWRACGEDIVREWVRANPGTRPSLWWRYSAPEPLPEDEDEAGFLARHHLLLPGELRRLNTAQQQQEVPQCP